MIEPYLDQLERLAEAAGVPLIQAFREAGVSSATYYRARQGTALHLQTAMQVANAIEAHTIG